MPTFESLRANYAVDWHRMVIREDKREAVDAIARKLIKYKARYASVSGKTGVPWFLIAVIHQRESDADFTTHLHNGDPLTRRTYHVPAGRPLIGRPPFTWEESAVDALTLEGFTAVNPSTSAQDWPLERCAYACEAYNGWGYYSHGVPSAYLWSFSNVYRGGKYVADGVWSSSAMDAQCGTMPMLHAMSMLDSSVRFDGSSPGIGGPKPIPVSVPSAPRPPDIRAIKPLPTRPLWRVFVDRILGRRT